MQSRKLQFSIVGAVILTLGIEQALPVPGLVGLLGIGVHEHLDIAGSQQATLAHLEDQEVLLLHDQSSQGANDRRRDAPIQELTCGHFERGAMQRADDDVADHIGALAHGRTDVRAQVADAEERPSLRLADQHVVAGQRQGLQLLGLQLGSLHACLDPGEGGKDRLCGVASRGLGSGLRLAGSCAAESRGLRSGRLPGEGRHTRDAARQVMANHVRHESHHGQASILELLQLHGLHALSILGELQGVESQVTGLTVHLADPRVLWEELALDDHGES
mmetsp:Transcript_23835/g.48982  ORF Transcript_23835/g.48982 Transcript_23835/m.48982 type:complete len:276 (-) Transcript_23835:715-1542(-)